MRNRLPQRNTIPPVRGVFRNCGEPSSLESVGQNRSHLGHGRHGACLHIRKKKIVRRTTKVGPPKIGSRPTWGQVSRPGRGPALSPPEGANTLAPRKGGVACIFHPLLSCIFICWHASDDSVFVTEFSTASDYCPSLEYHSLHCWDCTRDAVHHIHCWMQSIGVASFCIVQRSMSDRTARNRAAGVYPNDLVSRLRAYSNCRLCWKLLNPSTYQVHLHPGPLFAVRWAPPTREALCCSMRRSRSTVAPM